MFGDGLALAASRRAKMMLMITVANDVECDELTTTGGCSRLPCTIPSKRPHQERCKFFKNYPVKTAITTVSRQALSGIFGGFPIKEQGFSAVAIGCAIQNPWQGRLGCRFLFAQFLRVCTPILDTIHFR
jgi:hypothetical protein